MILRDNVWVKIIDVLNNYEYCILRNYEELPSYSNDIDILVRQSKLKSIKEDLIYNLKKVDLIYIRTTKYVCDSLYFWDKKDKIFLHIDLFPGHYYKIFKFWDENKVLENRIRFNNFYIPSNEDEFIDLLFTRFLYTKRIKEKYKYKIISMYKLQNSNIKNLIIKNFTFSIAERLDYTIKNEDWDYFNKIWLKVFLQVIKKNFNNYYNIKLLIKNLYNFLRRAIIKILYPYGMTILIIKQPSLEYKEYVENVLNKLFLKVEFITLNNSKNGFHFYSFMITLLYIYFKKIKNFLIIVELDNIDNKSIWLKLFRPDLKFIEENKLSKNILYNNLIPSIIQILMKKNK